METIWKYELEVTDEQVLSLPERYEILTVQIQDNKPCMWVKVCPDNLKTKVIVYTYGTGNPCHSDMRYISTYQLLSGGLVFHVFVDKI